MNYFRLISGTFALVAVLSSPLVAEEAGKSATEESKSEKAAPAAGKTEDVPVAKRSDDQLLADLDSGDPARQSAACRELGKRKVERAGNDLIGLLTRGTTAEVRRNAAVALGLIQKGGPATDALLKAAREDRDQTVRYGALVALANIQDKDKANETLELMKWTRDSSTDDLAKDLVTKLLAKLEKETKMEKKEPAKAEDEKKASS